MTQTRSIEKIFRASRAIDILITAALALFLLGLPFHLVIKTLLPGPIGIYWKEGLLGLLILLWTVQCVRSRQFLRSVTPLDWAVLVYLTLLVLRFALDRGGYRSSAGWVGAWGLYISVMYLPLFWLVPAALHKHPLRAIWLVVLLVGIGGIVALGGLTESLLNVSLWPSDEITQRLGHPDFYIYGTHVRRVYFTFDSPTTLANTLALLLPLAVALAVAPSPFVSTGCSLSARGQRVWKWVRAAMGAAALLMAACIIVTFSRGIWVATGLSLLAMGLLSSSVRRFVQRNLSLVLATGGVLILAGLTWGLVAAKSADMAAIDRVVELSPAAYTAASVVHTNQNLLAAEPIYGERVIQTWTIPDPIAGRDDTRSVLYEHPPASGKTEIIYQVQVPETDDTQRAALRFAIAVDPQVWSPEYGDGTSFQIYLTDGYSLSAADTAESSQFVFVRYTNPKHNPSDRRWRNFYLDLSPWAGRTVNLHLVTESGPAGDWAFDWGGWADLQVVRVDRSVFDSIRNPVALIRHASSIIDWVRDETNRDRLAAWNLSLAAWRAAPLWGKGLGTTGTAALRTDPEHAFVTESQVLKALVELGLPGLLALGYLWFAIARAGYRTYRATDDPLGRTLLLGIATGLLIIFVEGWVYQNLEVKQVNAYFWTLVGLLAFLDSGRETAAHE